MNRFWAWLLPKTAEDEDLAEWDRHHNDSRSIEGRAIFDTAVMNPNLTADELHVLWQRANKIVGERAPADYGEFLAYGYLQGRRDAWLMSRVLPVALGGADPALAATPGRDPVRARSALSKATRRAAAAGE